MSPNICLCFLVVFFTGMPSRVTKVSHQGKDRPSRIQQSAAVKVRISMLSLQKEARFDVSQLAQAALRNRTSFHARLISNRKHIRCPNTCLPLSQIRNAGNWLFSSRRWLNPRNPQDRDQLKENFDALCDAFPSFAARCEIATFLQTLHEISGAWARFLPDQDTGPVNYRPPASAFPLLEPDRTKAASAIASEVAFALRHHDAARLTRRDPRIDSACGVAPFRPCHDPFQLGGCSGHLCSGPNRQGLLPVTTSRQGADTSIRSTADAGGAGPCLPPIRRVFPALPCPWLGWPVPPPPPPLAPLPILRMDWGVSDSWRDTALPTGPGLSRLAGAAPPAQLPANRPSSAVEGDYSFAIPALGGGDSAFLRWRHRGSRPRTANRPRLAGAIAVVARS